MIPAPPVGSADSSAAGWRCAGSHPPPIPAWFSARVAAWHAVAGPAALDLTGRQRISGRPGSPSSATGARTGSAASAPLETLPDFLQHTALSPADRRTLLLGALLSPLARIFTTRKHIALVTLVVADSLKRRTGDGEAVAQALQGAAAMRMITRRALETAATEGPDAADAQCRSELSQALRSVAKEQWPLSLLLAAAADIAPALYPAAPPPQPPPSAARGSGSSIEPPLPPVPSAAELTAAAWPPCVAYARLGALAQSWRLDGCWGLKPLLEGHRLMAEFPGWKGPRLGRLVDEQMRWQLLHPDGVAADCLAHLRAFASAQPP